MSRASIEAYLFSGEQGIVNENASLFDCDVLVLNIPPGRKDVIKLASYPEIIRKVARQKISKKIIFLSSTGVYAPNNMLVTEDGLLDLRSAAKPIIDAEQIVQTNAKNWIILRLAGLVGPDREPGKWFAGKSNIPGGDTPVNMVHRDDCVEIISRLLSLHLNKEIFNICSDEHPIKKEFYHAQSLKSNYPPPNFLDGSTHFKLVDNSKIKKALAYDFKYPNPIDF